jgi:hypothetical protein
MGHFSLKSILHISHNQEFVFFIAALFTAQAAPLVLFSLYVASILAAMLT